MNDLKQQKIWVCWNQRAYKATGDRAYKKPLNPHTGRNAQSNNPATWGTFEQAAESSARMGGGVGFMFTGNVCGIDVDVKGNAERGRRAKEILAHMNTYSEYSPSGDGFHIIFTCDVSKLPQQNGKLDPVYYQKNPHNGLECYFAGLTNRYFTYTGETVNGEDVTDQTPQVLEFLDKYMRKSRPNSSGVRQNKKPLAATNQAGAITRAADTANISSILGILPEDEIISKARKARNKMKFIALFDNGDISGYNDDHSSADIALCNILAFYTGGDSAAVDRLFRQSALYRDKWEREDYRTNTINGAINLCGGQFYKPPKARRTSKQPALPAVLNVRTYPGADYFNPFATPEARQRYRWDDPGMGYLFADTYKNISRYVPEAKAWYVYDGRVWRLDLGGMRVAQQARDLMDYLLDCRKFIIDDEQREAWIKFITARRTKKFRDTMLADARSVYHISILEFDKDPYLFNCQNVTLNLRDFMQHDHRPEDFLSKISNVVFDPDVKCSRWETFIDEVMQGDKDKARFLQKALGYALVGDTKHECFFVLYGATTRNGKGTTMETTLHLMGDYGRTSQPESVAQKQTVNSGGPSEDIARLKGARFVNMSEPDKGLRLNGSLVKQLTGGDTVTARFLHQNSFEYRPEYKLFINTNHLPRVTDDSIFASGRVKLIPFERHFPENEQDKELKAFFKRPGNISGILNWFIEGLRLLNRTGLKQPAAISEALNKYREESNPVGQFIQECLAPKDGHTVTLKSVFKEYETWCDNYGYSPMSSRDLAEEMRKRGMTVKLSTGKINYLFGYVLVAQSE